MNTGSKRKKEARHMIDVSAAGRSSFPPSPPAADRPLQSQGSFGAALDATRREANAAQPKEPAKGFAEGEGLSLEELKQFGQLTDLDRLRLKTKHFHSAAATLADQCRAALDALEEGGDSGSIRESLHQAYDKLVRATEGAYGHLPHDSLTRILAMAEYAQKEGGLTK